MIRTRKLLTTVRSESRQDFRIAVPPKLLAPTQKQLRGFVWHAQSAAMGVTRDLHAHRCALSVPHRLENVKLFLRRPLASFATTLTTPSPRLILTTTIAVLMLGSANEAFAARLLHVNVYQDNKLVLKTAYQDNGYADAATIWRYLDDEPIWTETVDITPDENNVFSATLEGELLVEVAHVNTGIAQAKAAELTLVRTSLDDAEWFLPSEEVERTAQLAGLPPPQKESASWIVLAIVSLVAAALLVLGITAFVAKRIG